MVEQSHGTMIRLQYPVHLAFSMTMNKSQGQSLRYVGVDLREEVSSHGQLYVALSRATSGDRVSVLLPETNGGRPRGTCCVAMKYIRGIQPNKICVVIMGKNMRS
jgi:hypothetical protein